MVVCGQKLIPVKIEEVLVETESERTTVLTQQDSFVYSNGIECGSYYRGYVLTPNQRHVYGYILCRQCALKVGYLW